MDINLLPRGEEKHATLCVGMVEDIINNDESVFDLDPEQEEENFAENIHYTPLFLFLWKSNFTLYLRAKKLLCETYQGWKKLI